MGAAWTAAVGVDEALGWSGVSAFVEYGEVIRPDPANRDVYEQGYRRFRDIYGSLKHLHRG